MSVENTQRIKALLTGGARQQSFLGGSGLTRPSNERLTAAHGVARVENTATTTFSQLQETRGCFQNANSNNRYGNKQSNQEDKAQEVLKLPPNTPNAPQFNAQLDPLLFTNYSIGLQQWSQHMAKLVTYQRFHLHNLYGTLAADALVNTTPNLDHPASVADKSTLPSTTNVGHTGPKTTKLQSSKSIESSKNVMESNTSSNAKTQASASSKIIGNKGDSASIYKKGENKQKVSVSESLWSITGSKHSALLPGCTQTTNTTSTLLTSTTANAIKEKNTEPSKRSLANSMLCHPKMRAKTKMVALTSTKRKEPIVPAMNAALQQSEPPKHPTTIDFSKVTIPIGSLNDNSQLMTTQSLEPLMTSQSSKPLMTTQSPQITMVSHSTSTPLEMTRSGSLNPQKISSQLSKTSNNFQKHVKGQRLAQVIEKIGSTQKIPSSPKKTRKMSKAVKKCQDTIEDAIDKTVAIAKALADCEITDATLPKRWSSNPHLADSFSGHDVIINPPRHKSIETYGRQMTNPTQRESKFYSATVRHDHAERGILKYAEHDQKELVPKTVCGLTCKATSGTTTSITTGVVISVAPTSFPVAENAGFVAKTQQPVVSTLQHTQTLPSPCLHSWFSSKQTESLEMQVVGNYPSPITISKKFKTDEGTPKQKHTTMKHQSVLRHAPKDSTEEKHSNAKELELEIEASKTSKMPLSSKSLASENPVLSDIALSSDVVWSSSQRKCVSTHQQVGPKTPKRNLQTSSISIPSNLAPLQAPVWYQKNVIAVIPGTAENSRVATKPHDATCAPSTPNEPLDYSMGTLKKVEERQKQREDEQGYALDLSLPRRRYDRTIEGQMRNNALPSVSIAATSTSEVSTMKAHSSVHPVPAMSKLDALCMAALSTLSDITLNTKKKSNVESKRGRKRPKRLKRRKSGDFKAFSSHNTRARDQKAGNNGMPLRSNDGIAKGEFEIGSYLEVTRKAMTDVENKQRVNEELTNSTGDANQLVQPQDSYGGSTETKSKNYEPNGNVAEENQPPAQLSGDKSRRQETENVDPKSSAEYVNHEGNDKIIEKKEDDTIVIAQDKEPIESVADLVVMEDDPQRCRDEERKFGDSEKLVQLVHKVDQTNGGHVSTTNSQSKPSAAMSGGIPKVQINYEADVFTDSTKVPRHQCPKKLLEDTVIDRSKVNQGIEPSSIHDPKPSGTQAMCSATPPVTRIETAIDSRSQKSAEVTEASHHQCPKNLFDTSKGQKGIDQEMQPSVFHDPKPFPPQGMCSDTPPAAAEFIELSHHQSPKKLCSNQGKISEGIQASDLHDPKPSRTQETCSTTSVTKSETAIESGSHSSAKVTKVSHDQCPKKWLEDAVMNQNKTVKNQNKIDQGIPPFVLRDQEPSRTQTMRSAFPRETAIESMDITRNKKCFAALKSQNSAAKSHNSDKTSEEYISVKDTSSCQDDKMDEGGKSTRNILSNQAFDEGLFSDASDPDLFSDDLLFSGDEHERISLKSKKKTAIERKINLNKYKEGQAEVKSSENPRTALVWKNIDSPKSLGEERRNSPTVPESLQKFTTMTSSGRAQLHLVQNNDGAKLQAAEFQNSTGHYWHTAAEVVTRSCELNSPPQIKDSTFETATKSDRKVEKNTKGINGSNSEEVFNMATQYAESIPFDDIFQTSLKSSHKKLAQSDSNESRFSEHEIIVITPESLNSEKKSSSDINSDRKEDHVAENVADDDEYVATCVPEIVRDLSKSNVKNGAEKNYTAQNTRDETKLNKVLGRNPKVQAADDSDDVADADNDDDDVVFPSKLNHEVTLSKVALPTNAEVALPDVVRVGKDNSAQEAILKKKRCEDNVPERQQIDLKDEKIGNPENKPRKMTDSTYSVSKTTEKAENSKKSPKKANKDLAQQHGVLQRENISINLSARQPSMTSNVTNGHERDSYARKTFNTELNESTENLKVAERSDIPSKKVSKPRSPGKKKKSKAVEKRKEKAPNKSSPFRIRTTLTKRPNVKSERSKFIPPACSGKRKTGYNIHADLKGCDIKIKRRKLVKKDITSSLPKAFKTSPKRITIKHIDLSSDSSESSSDEAENFFKTDKIAKNITTKFRSPPEVTPPPKVLQSSPEKITSVVPHDDVSSDSSDSSDENEAFCRTDKMAEKFITTVRSDSNHGKENAFKSLNMAFPSRKPTTPKAILGTRQDITSSPSTMISNVSNSTETSSLYSPLIKRCSVRLDHPIQSPSGIFQSSVLKIQVSSKDTTSASPLKRKNISSDDAIAAKALKNSLTYPTEYQSSDVEPIASGDSTEDEDSSYSNLSSTSTTSTDSTASDTSTRARPKINLKAFVREAYSSSTERIRGAIVASAPGTGKVPKAPALNTKRKHGRWPFTAPFEARSKLVKPPVSDTTSGLTKSAANSPLKQRNVTEGIESHRSLKPLKFQVQEHNIPGRFETLHNVWRKSGAKTFETSQTTLPYLRESQTTEDELLKDIVDDIIQMSPPKKLKKSIIKPKSSRSQEKKFTNTHRTLSSLSKKKKAPRMGKEPKSTIRTQKSSRSPSMKLAYTHRFTASLTKKKKALRMETDPKSLIMTQKSLRSPGKKSTDTHRSKPSLPKKKKKTSKMEIDPVLSFTSPNSQRSPAKKSIYSNRPAPSLPKNGKAPRTEIAPNSSIIIPMSSGSQATKTSFTATNHFTTSLQKKSTPGTETDPKPSIITSSKSSGIQARKSMSTNRFFKKKQTARIKGNWTTEMFPDIGKISNIAPIHHQQSRGISKAERDENIYLTMQKLLNMGLIMDQMPRRGVPAPAWGDPMEFANRNDEPYELPESPLSSEHVEEIPVHPNLKVEWYTSQQIQLKPCSVVLKRLEIKNSRVNLISI